MDIAHLRGGNGVIHYRLPATTADLLKDLQLVPHVWNLANRLGFLPDFESIAARRDDKQCECDQPT